MSTAPHSTQEKISTGIAYPVQIYATLQPDGQVHFSCTAEVNDADVSTSAYGKNPVGEGQVVSNAFDQLSQIMKANAQI